MVRTGENSAVPKNKIYPQADMLKPLSCICSTNIVCCREPMFLMAKKKKIRNNLQTILCQSALTVKQLENKERNQEYLSQISFWLCYGRLLKFIASVAVSASQAK